MESWLTLQRRNHQAAVESDYKYDPIGNLVSDKNEGVQIDWNPYGKVREVEKDDNTSVKFRYDAAGNRIAKITDTDSTIYERDASGNVMAIYKNDTLVEQSLYGSSRLGLHRAASKPGYRTLGGKQYELSNHLGNVLAVVSDNIHMDQDSTWAQVSSISDYYPFGLAMEGRSLQDSSYRYLFNGNEIMRDHGLEVYDFKSRNYDPVTGRFWSIDVLADHPNQIGLSPYQFSWNNPIRYNDPDGKCPSCWPTFYAAYQGMKAKYSGILSQANAPVQRLISRDSGNTPSNIGMNETTRAAVRITGVSSDLNEITSVGKTLAQEAAIDVGNVLDKGGEVISADGLASTPITGSLGLTVMKFGDGVSAFGASSKGIGYVIAGEYNLAGPEFTKAGVSATTGYAVGKAVDVSKRVGNAAANDIAQESILQPINKGVNKISNYVIDFLYGKREEK